MSETAMKKPAQWRANPNNTSVAAQQHHSTAAVSDPLMAEYQGRPVEAMTDAPGTAHASDMAEHAVLPFYARKEHTSPAKYVSLTDLMGDVATNGPTVGPKGDAPVLTPYMADGKTGEHARASSYYLLVVDHDDDDLTADQLRETYGALGVAYWAFTSASHQQDKGGVIANRWKVLLPLAGAVAADHYARVAAGLALVMSADKAQARPAQIFYAPNRITDDAPFDVIDEAARPPLDANNSQHLLVARCLAAYDDDHAQRLAAAKTAPLKPRTGISAADGGIIEKVCSAYDMRGVLESAGYRKAGRRYLAPESSSGTPGVVMLPGDDGRERVFSHHSSDALANGYANDVFDAVCLLNYGGDVSRAVAGEAPKVDTEDQKQRQRDYMQAKAEEAAVVTFGGAVSTEAQKLADRIHQSLLDMLQVEADTDMTDRLKPDALRISDTIRGAFWSGAKSKVFLLTHSDTLAQFSAQDAPRFLARTFGAAIDRMAVAEAALGMDFGIGPTADKDRAKHVKAVMAAAQGELLDHLKYCNQRDSIEWRVDMFARQSHMLLTEDNARVVLRHDPFPVAGTPDSYERIVEDYKQHFPRFDEFLQFLVAARFAKDRKKAYLWILADSDWGKGFLMNGVLGEGSDGGLGAQVETSVKEVEAMFEGKPVGKSPEDFKRQFALVVDEFKSVKSEIKQLQSHLTLAPKHQLSCTVELFAKVFTSAESVGSLVTENGVEDQFANRMSIFVERGSIERRGVWQEVGKSRYLKSIRAYTARMINAGVEDYRREGREEAQTLADRWLDGFIQRNGLDTLYDRFSDSLPRVAAEIVHWLEDPQGFFPTGGEVVKDVPTDSTYLTSPGKVVERYIEQHFDSTEAGAYRKRKPEILRHMSADGKGAYPHRPNGRQVKCVMLKQTGQAYAEASQGW